MPADIANIAASIVTIGLVYTVLASPNIVGVIRSVTDGFAHTIAAAQGRSA